MKIVKIGRRILIGVALISSSFFIAYRVGTFDKKNIKVNNEVIKDLFAYELENSLNCSADISINSPPDNNIIEEDNYNVSDNNLYQNRASFNNDSIINNNLKESEAAALSLLPNIIDSQEKSSFIKDETSNNDFLSQEIVLTTIEEKSPSYENEYNIQIQKELQDLMNEYRKSLNLAILQYDEDLQKYANIRAKEISYFFSHTRPNGEYAVGSDLYKSEIIAEGNSKKSAFILSGWKNSSGHNAVMTSSLYTKFAIASITINKKTYTITIFS